MITSPHTPSAVPVPLRKVVFDAFVGGEPAPMFEYLLNQQLTRTRKAEQKNFRAYGYQQAVAREARVDHSTVRRYLAGERIGFETQKRIRAAIRRIDARG